METLSWVYAVFSAVCFINLRPTVIGEAYSLPISGILAAMNIVMILSVLYTGGKFSLDKYASIQLLIMFLTIFYTSARYAFIGGTLLGVKGLVMALNGVIALILICGRPDLRVRFFDTFAFLVFLCCLSTIVTFVLLKSGYTPHQLTIAHVKYTYGEMGDALFPFTFAANQVTLDDKVTVRLCGLFREPGILPVFACWAAAYLAERKRSILLSLVCLAASLASLSTMGPLALYVGAMLILYKFGIKPLPALAMVAVAGLFAWPVIFEMKTIGLNEKMHSGTGSYKERADMIELVSGTKDFIFGDGEGWSTYNREESISMLSSIRTVGLVGFFPTLAFQLMSLRRLGLWLAGLLPAVITMLVSQPISSEATILLIFMSWTAFIDLKQPDRSRPWRLKIPWLRFGSARRYRKVRRSRGHHYAG